MKHIRQLRHPLVAGAIALALLAGLALPDSVSAHERRKIAGDQAEAVVGWLVEPALVDQPNGVDFRVTNLATNEPIEGLEKTVKVEVTKGGATRTYDLRARFGQKGAYTADIIPTSTGDYTFRFTGEINGIKIDEKFESGPGRFNAIQPLGAVQFPTTQPTLGELKSQVAEAQAAADTARWLAAGGLAIGIAGLALAGVALLRRGRAAPGDAGADVMPDTVAGHD